MIHEILPVGMLECNCSILGDEQSGEALVVDPGDEVTSILDAVRRHGLCVKAIVVTHAHIDHIGGAEKLKAATSAPVYLNECDLALYGSLDTQASWLGMPTPARTEIDVFARDGDSLRVAGMDIGILHTPGHTPGSVSLWIPGRNMLLSGDTLFRGSIGRTDLPGGDGRQILRSIREKLACLPEDAVVIPGHGEATTIGREKRLNPFFKGL